MELADQQIQDTDQGLTGAEIPAETVAPAEAPEKPQKLSLRDQIVKNVETVRTEEAKRARAADGKFAKIEAGAAAVEKTEKPATAEIPKTEQNEQAAASPPGSPPSAWKNIWDKLPEDARAIAVKREAEVAKGFDEYRSKTAQLQEIAQAIDPIRPVLQQNGITSDAQAVKTLLQWENGFRNPQTRIQAFHALAQQYGVDLSTLVQNPSQPSTAEIPENLRPVIDQFGNVVQEVNTIKQQLQRAEQDRVTSELNAFAKDRPHFEKVRQLMGQLMTAGVASDLEGAYQQATKIHPEVSAQIAAEAEEKRRVEAEAAKAEQARKARLAAVSPSSRAPSPAPAGKDGKSKSVRDSLLSSVKELSEGQRA